MAFLSRLFGTKNDSAVVARGGVVAIRRAEIAALMVRPKDPNFAMDRVTEPCERCGRPLEEAFITTGGALGDKVVWRDHPVAVDGWACAACGVFRYPRKMDPQRIHELTEEGAALGRSGDHAGAELAFARIVWNWPGYFLGHVNYAEATRSRLAAEPVDDPSVERRLRQRMVEQYEAAVDAFRANRSPSFVAATERAYLTLAEHAIRSRASDRALWLLEECLSLEGISPQGKTSAEEMHTYVVEGRERFDSVKEVLAPYLRLQGRKPKAIESGDERKRVAASIETLSELVAHAPGFWQAAWFLGKAKEATGDVEGGIAVLRATHARHPGVERREGPLDASPGA